MKLQGKVALVTGAGSGIGEAIARRFAAEGATVHVTGVHAENTRRVTQEIRDEGGDAIGRLLDVSDGRAVAATIGAAIADSGRLDILVANAALAGASAYVGPLTEVTDEQWNRIIGVNLSGVFYCAREAARAMIRQRSGCIITLGSVNSFTPEADVPAYAASKGGVLMLTKSLARDLGPHGIRVNGIAPGGTDTPKMLAAIRQLGLSREELLARVPLGRRAEASEIAAVAAFLASDEASYVHGQMLVVDGGQLCT
ncbi:MAG TPA: glucose 1-dehydrogenase [Thermomicrobiales bacterium]|jgi:3-oxoacyl-[acyl-carrier protein] reductase